MKKSLLAAALALTLAMSSTSCLGPNNAYAQYNKWNNEVTDSKWWNELIFIPGSFVASLFLWGDYVIFNSIEFWGGDNPVSAPGGQPIHVKQ
jgi:hypothetical protein